MHVYVIEAPHGCKIGRSANPTRRIRGIETQGGFSATRAWITLPAEHTAKLERMAHSRLAEFRGTGEWFDVDFDRAVKTVCEVHAPDPAPEENTVASRLRLALAMSAQFTQRGIAEACGISGAAVSQWMSGETQNIRPENLFAAADYLGVSARWLATGSTHVPVSRQRLGSAISALAAPRFSSSKALANACGIDAGNLSRHMSGQQEIPLEKLNSIAGAIGVRVSEIYRAAEDGINQ